MLLFFIITSNTFISKHFLLIFTVTIIERGININIYSFIKYLIIIGYYVLETTRKPRPSFLRTERSDKECDFNKFEAKYS